MEAPVLMLFILAAVVCVSEAQNEIDGREVVHASEILKKIEREEPVEYENVIVEGDLDIGELKLPEVRRAGSSEEIKNDRPSKNLKVIRSPLAFYGCLIKGDVDFSNAIIQKEAFFL